jgi:protein TonB
VFERLVESGRTRRQPAWAPLVASAALNAVLGYGAATATRRPEAAPAVATETVREVVYLIPPPPQRVPFEQVGLQWAGGDGPGLVNAGLDEAALQAVEAGGDRGRGSGRAGRRDARDEQADSVRLAGEIAGGTVYVASETDQPVAFDPSSAAPAYPPELQAAGIEGSATMRFVVDSTGVADSATIEVLRSTHPAFAASVREAVPLMHFRPAELGARRVRQLVEQQFKFKLQPPAPPDSAAVAAAGADSAAVAASGPDAAPGGSAPGDSAPGDSAPR